MNDTTTTDPTPAATEPAPKPKRVYTMPYYLKLNRLLRSLGACDDARYFITAHKPKSAQEAWDSVPTIEWLEWVLQHATYDRVRDAQVSEAKLVYYEERQRLADEYYAAKNAEDRALRDGYQVAGAGARREDQYNRYTQGMTDAEQDLKDAIYRIYPTPPTLGTSR